MSRGKDNIHSPTDEIRKKIMSYGCAGLTQGQMAILMELDEKTLRKHYRRELDLGKVDAVAKIGGTVFQQAIDGDVASQLFFLKCQGGWREKSEPQNINLNIRDWTVKVKK